jgi:hypothetical protein
MPMAAHSQRLLAAPLARAWHSLRPTHLSSPGWARQVADTPPSRVCKAALASTTTVGSRSSGCCNRCGCCGCCRRHRAFSSASTDRGEHMRHALLSEALALAGEADATVPQCSGGAGARVAMTDGGAAQPWARAWQLVGGAPSVVCAAILTEVALSHA